MKGYLIQRILEAISGLKEISALLDGIRREGGLLAGPDLERIRSRAYEAADAYGREAADYLAAVRDAYRYGYGDDAEEIARLSLALQGAGGMAAELAGQYIAATDRAFQLGGSVARLAELLDGTAAVSSRNAIGLSELTEAMSLAGPLAASLGLGADEAAAALGTIASAAGQGGQEAAASLEGILLNIRQVADEGEGVSAEGIREFEAACRSLGVSLEETRDGAIALRSPMDVLGELSEAYSPLGPDNPRRSGLLEALGGSQAEALDALLSNYGAYEKMLGDYAGGVGSLSAQAGLAADSWEASMSRLSGTWEEALGNIADPAAVSSVLDALDGVLSATAGITEALGPLGSLGLGAGLLASLKDVGREGTYSPMDMPTAA